MNDRMTGGRRRPLFLSFHKVGWFGRVVVSYIKSREARDYRDHGVLYVDIGIILIQGKGNGLSGFYRTLPPKIMRCCHWLPLTESTRTPPLFLEYVWRILPLPKYRAT